MPVHFGPMSAWMVIITGVLLLAMTEYFRRTFQTQRDAGLDKKEICDRLDRMEKAIEKMDEHMLMRDGRNDDKLVSRVEFNGVAQRINQHDTQLVGIEKDARAAQTAAREVALSMQHLTQRIDDLIRPLGEKVDAIYKWKMLEHRDDPRP